MISIKFAHVSTNLIFNIMSNTEKQAIIIHLPKEVHKRLKLEAVRRDYPNTKAFIHDLIEVGLDDAELINLKGKISRSV